MARPLRMAALAAAFAFTSATAAFAVSVGGGDWSYGTSVLGVAYSNYYHGSVTHGSSVMVNSDVVRSQCAAAGQTAKAEKFRWPLQSASYYWRHC